MGYNLYNLTGTINIQEFTKDGLFYDDQHFDDISEFIFHLAEDVYYYDDLPLEGYYKIHQSKLEPLIKGDDIFIKQIQSMLHDYYNDRFPEYESDRFHSNVQKSLIKSISLNSINNTMPRLNYPQSYYYLLTRGDIIDDYDLICVENEREHRYG